MEIKQAGAGLGVFASIAAGAALVRWPYNLVAEAIMAAATLLAAATAVAWGIGLFYERIGVPLKRVTLLVGGILLGVYLAIAAAYFGGYIGYNYPASHARLSAQAKEIIELTATLTSAKADLASTQNQLSDAKKAMADPHSVSAPAYNIATSLKLQFDNAGRPQSIESHNVNWTATSVPQAEEIQAAPLPTAPQSETSTCSDPLGLTCNRYTFGLTYQQAECPKPGPTYRTNDALLLVLTFPYPVAASNVRLEAHGVELPKDNVLTLTEQHAVIMFQTGLRNTVLDIVANQPNK